MDQPVKTFTLFSYTFGILIAIIGLINTFWGNDPVFGVGVFFLSFIYFPFGANLFKRITGYAIPRIAKIILGLLILWVTLGVGELFNKIELMKNSF